MSRTLALLVLTLTGLSACAPSRDNFFNAYWEAMCDKKAECSETFENKYASVEECVEVMDDDEQDLNDQYEECDYDKDEAKECLQLIEDIDCDENYPSGFEQVNEACIEVFSCE